MGNRKERNGEQGRGYEEGAMGKGQWGRGNGEGAMGHREGVVREGGKQEGTTGKGKRKTKRGKMK